MAKTTLELKDDVYRKLAEASLEKYGNTKSLSKLANEAIEEYLKEKKLAKEDIKKRVEIAKRTAGIWKSKESGAEYVRRIRTDSEKRMKRLGL